MVNTEFFVNTWESVQNTDGQRLSKTEASVDSYDASINNSLIQAVVFNNKAEALAYASEINKEDYS